MSHPPGWYADPQTPPGYPTGVRWWDGQQWTETAHPATYHASPPSAPRGEPSTPDGEPLAGWGIRLAAYLIDALLVFAVAVAVGWPFVHRIGEAYADLFRQTIKAAETGAAKPNQFDVYSEIWLPLIAFSVVSIVLNFTYQVGFLRWRAATPGKLLLGLKVRLREQP